MVWELVRACSLLPLARAHDVCAHELGACLRPSPPLLGRCVPCLAGGTAWGTELCRIATRICQLSPSRSQFFQTVAVRSRCGRCLGLWLRCTSGSKNASLSAQFSLLVRAMTGGVLEELASAARASHCTKSPPLLLTGVVSPLAACWGGCGVTSRGKRTMFGRPTLLSAVGLGLTVMLGIVHARRNIGRGSASGISDVACIPLRTQSSRGRSVPTTRSAEGFGASGHLGRRRSVCCAREHPATTLSIACWFGNRGRGWSSAHVHIFAPPGREPEVCALNFQAGDQVNDASQAAPRRLPGRGPSASICWPMRRKRKRKPKRGHTPPLYACGRKRGNKGRIQVRSSVLEV